MASEFDLIKTYFEPLSAGLSANDIGIGDDGAVLTPPENQQMVVVTDTLVSGVHFPESCSAYDIAWKALAVNLSDLAAMGAKPGFFSLALTLPENNAKWLSEFARGLADLAKQYNIPLIGGDTTKGPLAVTITANGWVKKGQAILRSTAKSGDKVFVTNTLGDGALGLKLALNTLPDNLKSLFDEDEKQFLMSALNRPQPQLFSVPLLQEFASSAIDISDGFIADLKHIIEKTNLVNSQCKPIFATIELEQLPMSKPMQKYIQATQDWSLVLAGGDDYQLCFTVAENQVDVLLSASMQQGLKFQACGFLNQTDSSFNVEAADSCSKTQVNLTLAGKPYDKNTIGYLHF